MKEIPRSELMLIDLMVRVTALQNLLVSKNLVTNEEVSSKIEEISKAFADTLVNQSKN